MTKPGEVNTVPGHMAVRGRGAAWSSFKISSLLPTAPALVFLILLWGVLQVPRLISLQGCSFQGILSLGLPLNVPENEGGQPLLSKAVAVLTGLDSGYLPGILEHGLADAGGITVPDTGVAAATAPEMTGELPLGTTSGATTPDLSGQPILVAIYHTHNAETYIPWQGQSKVEGQNGGVSVVGNEIVKVLAEQGINSVHDLTIHDYPNFPLSYIKSLPTATRLVKQNPSLKALLDVHRDAGLPIKETVKVGGEDSARIIIVIGDGQRGLPDPNWRENYAFAQEVGNRLQEMYPGVLKQVRLMEGRYNQHVFPHAILVEVGSDKNTLNEALVAGRCFASALVAVINEKQ